MAGSLEHSLAVKKAYRSVRNWVGCSGAHLVVSTELSQAVHLGGLKARPTAVSWETTMVDYWVRQKADSTGPQMALQLAVLMDGLMVEYSANAKVEQLAGCLDPLMAGCWGHYLVGKKDQ